MFFYGSKDMAEEKKEEIWLSPMTISPALTEKPKKHHDNKKKNGRSVGVTAVNPTGVVKPAYKRSTFPLTATAV